MNRLKTWASGCALGVALCSGAQAELVDSVRVGDFAYMISASHLYVYNSTSGGSTAIELEMEPIAVDAVADGVFVAYQGKVEKRDLNGDIMIDATGRIERNLNLATDIAVQGSTLYASFNDGTSVYALSTTDLSAVGGAAPLTLTDPMRKIRAYPSSGAIQALYSPGGSDLLRLAFPVSLSADNEAEVELFALPPGQESYVGQPEDIFLLEGGTGDMLLMDNGTEWTVAGGYNGWIAGVGFRFLDQAEDDNWSVVRDKIIACEPVDQQTWGSDLIHYDTARAFDSRYKAGTPEELYEVVHLWGSGADPDSHLFRESAPGVLQVNASTRSEGLDFDDGKVPYSVDANAGLSDYQLQNGLFPRHVALSDDNSHAYVLHQGNERCQSMVRVYNLGTQSWESTIPLRWRADALATLGGATPGTSDDWLAVVYESAYDVYGSSDVYASFIDVNAPSPVEDPARDFADYGAYHFNLGTVEGSRHAVLFQVEVSSFPDYSLITGLGPDGGFDQYTHCDSESGCSPFSVIDGWDARAVLGETATLALKAEEDLSLLNFSESETMFSFSAPHDNGRLDKAFEIVEAPLVASRSQTFIAMNMEQDSIALFDTTGQAYSEGRAQDFLPSLVEAGVWSETAQGGAGLPAFYNLSGGDVAGSVASTIQNWHLTLGADGHATFEPAGEGTLAGFPLRVDVVDPATDSLLLTTVYQGQYRFTPIDKDITNAPGFVPDAAAGGGDSGDDEPDSEGGSSSGGGNSSAVSGSGFSSGGGGGGAMGSLLGVLLLIALRRRTTTTH